MVAAPRKIAALCVALASFGFVLPSMASAQDPVSAPASEIEKRMAGAIAEDHHEARLDAGLGSLGIRTELATYAESNSVKMVTTGAVGHSDINKLIADFPSHDWAGENALVMFNPAGDATNLWLGSPAHRANLMAPQATHMFISVRCGSDGRAWITAQYVQDDSAPRVVPDTVTDADRALQCPRPQTGFAPFTNAESLVAQQYLDILGRPADSGGLNYWAGLLRRKEIDSAKFVQILLEVAETQESSALRRETDPTANSPEVEAQAQVTALYRTLLRREPDAAGLAHWSGVVRSDGNTSTAIKGLLASPEYSARF